MTDERSRPEATEVTGVAKGPLGTGTALDETQVWEVPAVLQAPAPRQEPAPLQAPAPHVAARLAPLPAVPAEAAGSRRRPSSAPIGSPRTAGIAAAVLLALVAVAAALGSFDGIGLVPEGGDGPPAAESTANPTDAPDEADGGGGGGNGDGNGRGDGGGRGNGGGNGNNGNGNGNGGGDDDDD